MATTSSSSTTAFSLVTALGGGSGVDMAALANNLAVAQFADRTERLSTRSDKLNTQISDVSTIKSMLLNLSASLGERLRVGDLSAQPAVASSAVATATLSGTKPASNSFSLEVTKLATGQTLSGGPYASASAAVGSGTLTLRFGETSGSTFTEGTRTLVSIAIGSGATLADVAKAINASGSGVTAYVASTADGARLVLKGEEGAANGFVVEASEDAAEPGLSALAWAPGASTGNLIAGAGNAGFNVDGLAITTPSNTVANAIPGVTLQLRATNSGAPTIVSFTDPSAAITAAMTDLTSALNEVMSALNSATDAQTGSLRSDSGARALKRTMSALAGNVIMPSATGRARTLSDLGLSIQRDGTFVLDSSRLAATLAADPDGVAAMFTTGLDGIYTTFDKISRSASLSSDPGSLGGSITRYTRQLQQLGEDQTELAEKQEALRASLSARFTVSEGRISQSQSTLEFLQNQIAAWNKSSD